MRESTRKGQDRVKRVGGWRLSHLVAVCAVTIGIALGPAPALADTGSVYYDSGSNVAAGALLFNGTFTGVNNVGLGYEVMPSLTTGNGNIAIGNGALDHVTTGLRNVGIEGALYSNTTGSDNVSSGFDSLLNNSSGDANIASGFYALAANSTGDNNIATGYQALYKATGNRNIALGANAGANLTTGSDNIDIANPGVPGEAGRIRIGTDGKQTAAYLAGVWGKSAQGPTKTVVVNNNGRLGTAPAPAAPLAGKSRELSRLRDQVDQLRASVQRLREEVRPSG